MSGWYDVAQICSSGHVVNDSVRAFSQNNRQFCDKCGSPTITSCPNCSKEIRGRWHFENVVGAIPYVRPAYCSNCGKPFPWTERAINAAQQYASEVITLSDEERGELSRSIPDLVHDSPSATISQSKFKRLVTKAGKETAGVLREILINVASDAAKKSLWGQ